VKFGGARQPGPSAGERCVERVEFLGDAGRSGGLGDLQAFDAERRGTLRVRAKPV
jgi:hypothetical protein